MFQGHDSALWQLENIPQMKDAQLGSAMAAIAVKLFGEDAFAESFGPLSMIRPDLEKFIKTILSYVWNQSRKTVKHQFTKFETGKKEASEEFESTLVGLMSCIEG